MSKATEHVYTTVRRRIMAGSYAPGTQLKEAHLAEELSVSRTPVRAALQRLVGDGLLIPFAGRGVFVPEWNKWDILEVFDLRILLEGHAAQLAATRAEPAQIAEMGALTDRMERLLGEKAPDYLAGLQDANFRFHLLLLEAAAAPRLRRMAQELAEVPLLIGGFYLYEDADMRRSIQHHRDLILALEARDGAFARNVIQVHLRASYETLMRNRSEWSGALPHAPAAVPPRQGPRPPAGESETAEES